MSVLGVNLATDSVNSLMAANQPELSLDEINNHPF